MFGALTTGRVCPISPIPGALRRDGVFLQIFQVDKFECRDVGCFEHDLWSGARLQCLLPALDAQAPPIARFQSWKTVSRNGRAEVVTNGRRKFQEGVCGNDADQVEPGVIRARVAAAVSIKSSAWVETAGFQRCSQDVVCGAHWYCLARGCLVVYGDVRRHNGVRLVWRGLESCAGSGPNQIIP